LTGKVAIVTGANTGIGKETARELARKGCEVIVAARNVAKGQAAVEEILASVEDDVRGATGFGKARVRFLQLDLASLTSVKLFADAFKALDLPLHILVNNAGVMMSPGAAFVGREFTYGYSKTLDGFESQIGINHIGHFYLTHLLEPLLIKSAPSRVIAVSSAAEKGAPASGIDFKSWRERQPDYEDGVAYGQSKLANLLFARELAERLETKGVSAYSCHPGVIATELSRYMEAETAAEAKANGAIAAALNDFLMSIFSRALLTPPDGALTQLYLSSTTTIPAKYNGGFFVPIATPAKATHPQAHNTTLQKELWKFTETMVKKYR